MATPRRPRASSGVPAWASICAMRLLTAEGTMASRCAASAMLRSSQTATNRRNEVGSKGCMASRIGTLKEKTYHFRDCRVRPSMGPLQQESAMRIVNILERTAPIASPIANAFIDFSKMTLSLVAVVTDVVRDGKPVVGYGFNSNGRYGQGGLIRERFAPRILEAAPDSLRDDARDNIDAHKVWATMFTNEKPGGHGERSVAIGTFDMAVWDAVAKIANKPLFRLLSERYGTVANPKVFVYAAGGYYYPGKGLDGLATEMKSYLDRGYNVVKM